MQAVGPKPDNPPAGAAPSPTPSAAASVSATKEKVAKPAALTLAAAPRYMPVQVSECGSVGNVRTIMKEGFNQSMTMMFFGTFRTNHPLEERTEMVVEGSAQILGCISKVHSSLQRTTSEERWPGVDFLLNQLQLNTQALQTAALEYNEPQMAHWFAHVKQNCAACHSVTWNDRDREGSSDGG